MPRTQLFQDPEHVVWLSRQNITLLARCIWCLVHSGTAFTNACHFSSSVTASLHRAGVVMPRDTARLPPVDVHAVFDALKADLGGSDIAVVGLFTSSSRFWCHVKKTHLLSGYSLLQHIGVIVNSQFLVDTCSDIRHILQSSHWLPTAAGCPTCVVRATGV